MDAINDNGDGDAINDGGDGGDLFIPSLNDSDDEEEFEEAIQAVIGGGGGAYEQAIQAAIDVADEHAIQAVIDSDDGGPDESLSGICMYIFYIYDLLI